MTEADASVGLLLATALIQTGVSAQCSASVLYTPLTPCMETSGLRG